MMPQNWNCLNNAITIPQNPIIIIGPNNQHFKIADLPTTYMDISNSNYTIMSDKMMKNHGNLYAANLSHQSAAPVPTTQPMRGTSFGPIGATQIQTIANGQEMTKDLKSSSFENNNVSPTSSTSPSSIRENQAASRKLQKRELPSNTDSVPLAKVEKPELSPKSSRTTARSDVPKRAAHNEVEKRRRDKINNWIMKLGEMLPASYTEEDHSRQAQSKGVILYNVAEYIKDLCSTNNSLSCQLEASESMVMKLESENQELRAQAIKSRDNVSVSDTTDSIHSPSTSVDFTDDSSDSQHSNNSECDKCGTSEKNIVQITDPQLHEHSQNDRESNQQLIFPMVNFDFTDDSSDAHNSTSSCGVNCRTVEDAYAKLSNESCSPVEKDAARNMILPRKQHHDELRQQFALPTQKSEPDMNEERLIQSAPGCLQSSNDNGIDDKISVNEPLNTQCPSLPTTAHNIDPVYCNDSNNSGGSSNLTAATLNQLHHYKGFALPFIHAPLPKIPSIEQLRCDSELIAAVLRNTAACGAKLKF